MFLVLLEFGMICKPHRRRCQAKIGMVDGGWWFGVRSLICAAVLACCAPQAPAPTETNQGVRATTSLTALQRAARNGDFAAVKNLVEEGDEVDRADAAGWTALHHTVFEGHERVAAFLLSRGAKVEVPDTDGWTPLHTAAFNGHAAIVELLLSHGADIQARDLDGDTALVLARLRGHGAIREMLVA